jgi:VWFA-related protein
MTRPLSVVLLSLATVSLGAQAPPTFRAGANFVRVDMYPTLDGVVVSDLRPDEVELLEDASPQRIDTFEHVRVRAAGPEESRVEPNTVEESRQMATDPRARVFVIFLDTMHTQIEGSSNMRLPLVRFLDRVLGQDDLVALMTPEMSGADLAFGRKTTVISNIMQNEWTWGRRGTLNSVDSKEQLYEACYPNPRNGDTVGIAAEMKARRREKLTLDALEDLLEHLQGIREERKAVLTISEGWRIYDENRQLAAVVRDRLAPADALRRTPAGAGGREERATGVMMRECEADRVALSMLSHTQRLRAITETANRSNATFYPVYARGLAVFDAPIGPEPPPAPSMDRQNLAAREDSLRQLAADTDGIAVVATNRIDQALKRIAADLSSYYLLGYYSTNTRLDGRFRSITVRIRRPGVQVRARRGYRGATADQLFTAVARERGVADRTAPTRAVVDTRATFRIRAVAWMPSAGDGLGSAWVVGELDYTARRELVWSAGASAEVALVAADGTEVMSTTVPVPASDGSFSLKIPDAGGLAAGEYALRVRVRPDADPTLPVTDTVRLTVPKATSVLGDAVMWRRGPSTGLQHLATADPRFRRGDRIRLEMATETDGAATARMLDRVGNPLRVPVQVSERADPSGLFRWVVTDAALSPLAAGDYAIEVTLAGARRLAPFQVVP